MWWGHLIDYLLDVVHDAEGSWNVMQKQGHWYSRDDWADIFEQKEREGEVYVAVFGLTLEGMIAGIQTSYYW